MFIGKQSLRVGDDSHFVVFSRLVYVGAVIHFFPSWVAMRDNYALGAYHVTAWDPDLHRWFWGLGWGVTWVGVFLTSLAIVGSGWGVLRPRSMWPHVVAVFGYYGLANLNSLHTQTLGLSALWAMLWLMSLGRALRLRDSDLGVLGTLYFLGTLAFSGIEKLEAGWPQSGALYRLIHYPPDGVVRDWAVGRFVDIAKPTTYLFEYVTLLVEVGVPVLVLVRATSRTATALYLCFFLLLLTFLSIPPLFAILYFGAAVLFPCVRRFEERFSKQVLTL